MKIELRKLSDIKPYPGNPRVNDDAVDSVAASIREFGFRQPIVVGCRLWSTRESAQAVDQCARSRRDFGSNSLLGTICADPEVNASDA